MSQAVLTLELPEDVYEHVRRAAKGAGRRPSGRTIENVPIPLSLGSAFGEALAACDLEFPA